MASSVFLAAHDPATPAALRAAVARYEAPSLRQSVGQIVTSIGLFIIACAAMYASLSLPYFVTLLLAVPAAGLLVRVFIVQHDCGHGAFFRSRRANHTIGMLCSLLTFAPYANWRRQHAGHHGIWNNLDRRQAGADIYSACLTVAEYQALTPSQRFFHRALRHPVIAHLMLPPLVFVLLYRVPFDTPRAWKSERLTVYATDVAIALWIAGLVWLFGFRAVLLVQLPVITLASIIGVWLFSVQHRFDGTRWARQDEWSFTTAALQGSSYLRLPRLLQWFTGNIGFHQIHHLNPHVPNYRLEECYNSIPTLRAAPSLSLWSGLKSVRLALWDEANRRLIGFADVPMTPPRSRDLAA